MWCRLVQHDMRLAAGRIFWTAGSSSPMRMAMMAMTTSSSISVKAWRRRMVGPPGSSYRSAESDGTAVPLTSQYKVGPAYRQGTLTRGASNELTAENAKDAEKTTRHLAFCFIYALCVLCGVC